MVLKGPLCGGEGAREGIGTEMEKRGRKKEKGRGGKLEQGRRLAKTGPALTRCTLLPD